jgi:hypothetical protein
VVITWPTITTTGLILDEPFQILPEFLVSTGFARTRMEVSCGQVSGRTCACSSGLSSEHRGMARLLRVHWGGFGDLDWSGLSKELEEPNFIELMSIDRNAWYKEVSSHKDHFFKLYGRLPKEMIFMNELILSSLWRSPPTWDLSNANE